MNVEIEYKFLVKDDSYKSLASRHKCICQGYLCREPDRTVRVRTVGDRGFLTVKGVTRGAVRDEFEYEIPYADAKRLMEMCVPPIIKKERWYIPFGGNVWEVDEFQNPVTYVTAEIEVPAEGTEFALPPFVGENVTGNPDYYNSNLGMK